MLHRIDLDLARTGPVPASGLDGNLLREQGMRFLVHTMTMPDLLFVLEGAINGGRRDPFQLGGNRIRNEEFSLPSQAGYLLVEQGGQAPSARVSQRFARR